VGEIRVRGKKEEEKERGANASLKRPVRCSSPLMGEVRACPELSEWVRVIRGGEKERGAF